MIKAGKLLVFMEESCNYAINKFKMPVTNIMEENSKVICPGSYLRAEVKASPLTAGMDESAAIFFNSTPTFETSPPRAADESRFTPLVFGERDLLLSGWLEGDRELVRKSLLVDFRKGKGRIILIGPDVIHRTHSEATYKIMFNSLLAAAEGRTVGAGGRCPRYGSSREVFRGAGGGGRSPGGAPRRGYSAAGAGPWFPEPAPGRSRLPGRPAPPPWPAPAGRMSVPVRS